MLMSIQVLHRDEPPCQEESFGGRPCVINVGTFERLNVGTFNVPAHDFGQTPREIAKGGRRIAKMRNGDPSFRNSQFDILNSLKFGGGSIDNIGWK
jgi:hypothetical protein